jgi:hypothetical protein
MNIMKAFESFIGRKEEETAPARVDYDNVIYISDGYASLKGIGTEYVVINGEIVAKFYNGMFPKVARAGNTDQTIASS